MVQSVIVMSFKREFYENVKSYALGKMGKLVQQY